MAPHEEAWDLPPARLETPNGTIHVWRASLDPPPWGVERLTRVLSDAELIRAGQFCLERDRKRFITGRGVLRMVLEWYLAVPPDRLEIRSGAAGKPALAASQAGGIEFSVSHSHGLALYAVTCDRRIGIDIERVRTVANVDLMALRVLSLRERAVLRALPPEQRRSAFFCGWTRKEAYLKACGEGLSRPLDRIDVSLPPFEPARPLSIQGDPQASSDWSIQELAPAPGFAGALANEGTGTMRLSFLQWPQWL